MFLFQIEVSDVAKLCDTIRTELRFDYQSIDPESGDPLDAKRTVVLYPELKDIRVSSDYFSFKAKSHKEMIFLYRRSTSSRARSLLRPAEKSASRPTSAI